MKSQLEYSAFRRYCKKAVFSRAHFARAWSRIYVRPPNSGVAAITTGQEIIRMNDYESEHETMFEGDCITEAIETISAAICEHIANDPPESVALIGIQAGGVPLAKRIARCIRERTGREVDVGTLDISMYRDDIGKRKTLPMIRETDIPFDINDKIIILADDVLQSGRSVRAALDALTDFGRPGQIRLAALIDRGGREFPIHADYVGMKVSVGPEWRVCMDWAECSGTDCVFKVKKQ